MEVNGNFEEATQNMKEATALQHALSLVDRQNKQIQTLRAEKIGLESENAQLKLELRKLQTDLESAPLSPKPQEIINTKELEKYKHKIRHQEAEIINLKQDLDETKTELEFIQDALRKSEGRLCRSKSIHAEQQKTIIATQDDARQEVMELFSANQRLMDEVADLEHAQLEMSKKYQEEMSKLEVQLEEGQRYAKDKELELLRERAQAQDSTLAIAAARDAALRQSMDEKRLRESYGDAQINVARLEEKIESSRILITHMKKTLKRYKRRIEMQDGEMMKAFGENKELKKEIENLISQHKQVIERMRKSAVGRLDLEIELKHTMARKFEIEMRDIRRKYEAEKRSLQRKCNHLRESQQLTEDYLNAVKNEVIWHKSVIKKVDKRLGNIHQKRNSKSRRLKPSIQVRRGPEGMLGNRGKARPETDSPWHRYGYCNDENMNPNVDDSFGDGTLLTEEENSLQSVGSPPNAFKPINEEDLYPSNPVHPHFSKKSNGGECWELPTRSESNIPSMALSQHF